MKKVIITILLLVLLIVGGLIVIAHNMEWDYSDGVRILCSYSDLELYQMAKSGEELNPDELQTIMDYITFNVTNTNKLEDKNSVEYKAIKPVMEYFLKMEDKSEVMSAYGVNQYTMDNAVERVRAGLMANQDNGEILLQFLCDMLNGCREANTVVRELDNMEKLDADCTELQKRWRAVSDRYNDSDSSTVETDFESDNPVENGFRGDIGGDDNSQSDYDNNADKDDSVDEIGIEATFSKAGVASLFGIVYSDKFTSDDWQTILDYRSIILEEHGAYEEGSEGYNELKSTLDSVVGELSNINELARQYPDVEGIQLVRDLVYQYNTSNSNVAMTYERLLVRIMNEIIF